jgi:hypothetical protein
LQNQQRYKWIERVVLFISVVLCLMLFVQDRSLLLDSLNVARNIGERSYAVLINPLSYEQSAPLLFLWASKFLALLFGMSHYSLRLLPLITGLASLFLFADISKKVLKSPFSIIALFWFGTHQLVARYATEYKQYMIDVFATLLIIWVVIKIGEINKENWWKLALGGSIVIWLSMPSVFVLISALVYFGITNIKKSSSISPLLWLAGFIGLSFIANYLIMLRPTIGSDHMQNFHNSFFLEGNILNLDSLAHDFGLIVGQARMIVGKSGLAIGAVLLSIIISVFISIKQKRYEIILFILPIVGAFGASLFGKYSILERLMLFSLPLFILLVMMGIEYVYQNALLNKAYLSKGILGILALGLIVGFYEKQSFKYMFYPFEHEDNRSSLLYISNHQENEREIICTQHAVPAFDYYTRYDINYKVLNVGSSIPTKYNTDIKALALERLNHEEKVWILANHYQEHDIENLISSLREVAIIENSYRAKSSAAIIISTKGLSNK